MITKIIFAELPAEEFKNNSEETRKALHKANERSRQFTALSTFGMFVNQYPEQDIKKIIGCFFGADAYEVIEHSPGLRMYKIKDIAFVWEKY